MITPVESATTISGSVHGGTQPIAGANIQIWAVGSGGDGAGATLLTTTPVMTGTDGSFSVTDSFTCPAINPYVYLTAVGGTPVVTSKTTNSQASLMTALGPCMSLASIPPIAVNEVTTVGSVAALYPYMTAGTNGWSTLASNGSVDSGNLDYNFAEVSEYTDTVAGTAPGPALSSGFFTPTKALDSLANSVAACVNSLGGKSNDGTPCGMLFHYSTPSGGTAPTDTVSALIDIFNNPNHNVSAIYNIATANVPFLPDLSSAPTSWALPILGPPPAPSIQTSFASVGVTPIITMTDMDNSATVYYTYTTDGPNGSPADPTIYSTPYTGAFTPAANLNMQKGNAGGYVKAIAVGASGLSSTVSETFYSYTPSDSTGSLAFSAVFPHLSAALQNSPTTPLYVLGLGSSVGVGATLPDANTQAPVSYFTSQLQATLNAFGNPAVLLPSNQSVNGSIAYQYQAAFSAAQQALSGVQIDNPGIGYAVGDFLTVNQGVDPTGGLIVQSIGPGGSITGLKISSYTNSITDADQTTPSTGGYTLAQNVPVTNGPGTVLGAATQTGTGSNATVNITKVGITPTVVVFAYGMNDGGIYQYHAGETFPGFMNAMQSAMQQAHALNADCVVLTTPHPEVVTYASTMYDYPGSVGEGYPVYVAAPVPPNELVPTAADSNVTQDFLQDGVPITMGYRFLAGGTPMLFSFPANTAG